MVVIQVLIADVTLRSTDEFGVELGLQDAILFDRSTATGTGLAQSLVPGFNFNNQPLGNSGSASALASANNVGGQSLTNFAVGRSNGDLGFGGLVLSASSESVSVLLRALKENRRLEVLARPQLTTLNNQTAYVQVGQHVPTVAAVSLTNFGQTNSITYYDVGVILQVTPRISPDGMVVMEIDAIRSEVGPESEGIPISITNTGGVIRAAHQRHHCRNYGQRRQRPNGDPRWLDQQADQPHHAKSPLFVRCPRGRKPLPLRIAGQRAK